MTSNLTVRDLFISTHTGTLDAGLRLPPPPDGLTSLVTGFEWDRLGERVLDLLDVNVVDVLVGGWKNHQDVHRELGRTATDPTRTAMVQLTHHTIESTHAPAIELRAQGRKVLEVSFPVELSLEIDAVRLTIRGGAIREIHPGEVKVRGTMKLENTVVLERQLSAITLPGRIVLHAPAPESVLESAPAAAAV
jgi:hypothetical protein